jgi:hypothetical protein
MTNKIYILYNVNSEVVVGCYSTLELAIQYGKNTLGCCICWCVIESKLDEPPNFKINNIYQNDIENY